MHAYCKHGLLYSFQLLLKSNLVRIHDLKSLSLLRLRPNIHWDQHHLLCRSHFMRSNQIRVCLHSMVAR